MTVSVIPNIVQFDRLLACYFSASPTQAPLSSSNIGTFCVTITHEKGLEAVSRKTYKRKLICPQNPIVQ